MYVALITILLNYLKGMLHAPIPVEHVIDLTRE